jgi:hypothetical protein
MAHVKPKNCQSWDVHGNVGFNIYTAMEHHRCFHIYIVKMRATRISNLIFFKHQYITNPQLTPETLVLKAASELTSALKGTVWRKAETADALAQASKLFHIIAEAKAAMAKAKEQQNTHQTHPNARRAAPLPRVLINPHNQPAVPLPRVQAAPPVDDCCVVGGGNERQIVHIPTQIVGSQLQIVGNKTPCQGNHGPPSAGPNYISQDEDEEHSHGYNTWSRTTSIMQEAMLACIDITKPNFKILAVKMASRKLPMTWFCEMANSVLCKHGKLLEYRHLIANPKTRATWTHSYGNKLRRLAQGMPGQAKGMDTIFFIPRHMVPKERARDVTYGLITCLI